MHSQIKIGLKRIGKLLKKIGFRFEYLERSFNPTNV